MDRYARMFDGLAQRDEGAFGAFVMLGDPDFQTSGEILDALVEGGADMLEVGIPFSDPVADGPVIQAAAERALARGMTPAHCFQLLKAFRRRHPDIPVGILTYANLVVARGASHFYRAAAEAGVDSVLVADVPLFEARPFAAEAQANGIAPVLIAAQNTPDDTLKEIAELGGGYTYCVARAGVTGAAEAKFDHGTLMQRLAANQAPPPVLGFGISRPDHVEAALASGAAGVISGSAIVKLIEEHGSDWRKPVTNFISAMKAATRR